MGRGSSKAGGGGGGFKIIQNARQFDKDSDADEFFAGSLDSLTDKEKNALEWYTSGAFFDYNASLRAGENNHPNRTKSMDSAMAKANLSEPITVYRGSSPDLLGFKGIPTMAQLQSLIGQSFVDKAFVSTSTNPKGGFGGTIRYKIMVPAGKGRGQYIKPISHFKSEQEFLINRNTRFKVVAVSPGKGLDSSPIVSLQIVN